MVSDVLYLKQAIPQEILKNAQWISCPVFGGRRTVSPAIYYRKVFELDERLPEKAFLHITALGLFEWEINGAKRTEDVLTPGWTNYHRRVYLYSYEVTDLLKKGKNVIGVILGDGWYSGHIAAEDRQQYGEQPMFLACLEGERNGRREPLVLTDGSWKYSRGPIIENDLIMGEAYDARRELGPWTSAEYDDQGWLTVCVMPSPQIQIGRSPAPPIRRQERLIPEIIFSHKLSHAWDYSRIVYDFKQNFTGRVRIYVQGPRGLNLRLRYAEMLKSDGKSLYTENLRTARATDYYTLKGEGTEIYEPSFTFHGFRYMEISWKGKGDDVVVEKVEGVVLHSDLQRIGYFSCSHPLINQLTHNILWGLKSNFVDVPTDCPQRDERLGWTGDAQVFCRTAAFFMDVKGFFEKWLQDIRDAQAPNGSIPPVAPAPDFIAGSDGGPGWADATFICPWTMYLTYGDKKILEEHYECMVRHMEYICQYKTKDGIRCHPDIDPWGGFGDWLALDGSGRTDGGTPKDLIGTAFYAYAADIMTKVARLLHREKDEAFYATLRQQIQNAFIRRFVSDDGRLIGDTQTAYVLALHFNLLPDSLSKKAARRLVQLIRKNKYHLGTGFLGTPYILHVLERYGYLDLAYRLLEQETFPSWLFSIQHGATTIWERWDGWTPEKGFQDPGMNSFNHYAYGAVGNWLVTTVGGLEIDPEQPGYRHILFKPRPGGSITWADTKLQTHYGEIHIRWELNSEKIKINLTVPSDTIASLSLSKEFGKVNLSLLPGEYLYEFKRRTK